MTAWFFFAVLHLVYISWYAQEGYFEKPQLIGWEMPLPLLHGPFLYLYISSLTNQKSRFPGILHFLPFLLAYLVLAPVLLSMPAQDWLNEVKAQQFRPFFNGFLVVIIISGITYVILSLILLHRHRKNIADQFSSTDKITLNWLRYLIAGIGVIWGVVIFYRTPQTLYISVALFMFFIGYFGIKQVGIFCDPPLIAPLPTVVPADALPTVEAASETGAGKMKYERTGVTEEEVGKIHEALINLMQGKQLYKEPELTLGDLAKELQVHPSILSQVINSQEQMSFYDYINTQRVAAFKQILQQPESRQFTLLSLAFECGFNSKSSFNRNFRKMMQCSPTDYLKLNNIYIANADTNESPAAH
ncbi:helix-turn-helix transcriptional regulator [Chitinophaga sp.]|uniref:helix-turn-helix domain-containing protein n=1 Tax=Chitinophaga sp. TaxID=1869181 RepID=UPI002F936188